MFERMIGKFHGRICIYIFISRGSNYSKTNILNRIIYPNVRFHGTEMKNYIEYNLSHTLSVSNDSKFKFSSLIYSLCVKEKRRDKGSRESVTDTEK